jgi:type IV pilus assembly protein PilW
MNPTLLARRAQQGFTLIEILIALLVGLFLMGALLTVVQTNRRVFGEQNQMAQLQDNERMALTMIADVIQSAGYYPQPPFPALPTNTLTTTLVASGSFAIGQSIYGASTGTSFGDQIQVRYMTAGGDNILNCSGQSNPVGQPNTLYVNSFQVKAGQLVCTLTNLTANTTTDYTLVGNTTASNSGLDIISMTILYGVKANPAALGNDVDTYMSAAQVNATPVLWGNVISVLVQLTFTNPLYAANPAKQPQTVQIQRVIDVMSQTGPTL